MLHTYLNKPILTALFIVGVTVYTLAQNTRGSNVYMEDFSKTTKKRYKYYIAFGLLFMFLQSNSQSVAVDSAARKARLDSFMQDLFYKREQRKREAIGKPFNQFSISTGGKKISNKDLEHKVVFINLWFAGCKPCLKEFDELNSLFEKFKSNKSFLFLSFTFDSPEVISETRKKFQLKFKSYSIPAQECYKLNQGSGFPTSILIGKDGRIKQFYDAGISKENIEAVCQDILSELNTSKS